MTTRELMSAAAVMMMLAGVPAIAQANDETAPVAADETVTPTDEATTADEGTFDEETSEEAPAE